MLRTRTRARGGSGGGGVPLQLISTGGQTLGQSTTGLSGTTTTRDDGRHIMKVPHTANDVRMLYGNFYFNPSTSVNEIPSPSTITVDGAIEYASNFYPQLFNSASTKAIAGSDSLVLGDPIAGLEITGGSNIYMRHSTVVTLGQAHPVGRQRQTALSEANIFTNNVSSQTNATGAMTGSTVAFGFAPLAVVGRPATRKVSIALIGDSIADGVSYDVSTGDGNANVGSFARAFYASDIPFVKITRGSMRTIGFTPTNAPRAWEIIPYCSHVVFQAGTNDLGQAASGDYTLEAIQARYNEIWAAARAMGKKVIQVKIFPRTTSTDSWATAINQTPLSRFGVGQDRDILNAWFDSELAAGRLDGVWDLNTIYEDGTSGKWVTNGTNFFATSDGTHPSQNAGGFTASVATIQALAEALTI
jgi:lysophospholipase L1-like esterase